MQSIFIRGNFVTEDSNVTLTESKEDIYVYAYINTFAPSPTFFVK